MTKVRADALKIGDKIMPPAREVQLWMRRHIQERHLSEAALHLTITNIREGSVDKGGLWLVITTDQSAEWNADRANARPFTFTVRPTSLWPKVA